MQEPGTFRYRYNEEHAVRFFRHITDAWQNNLLKYGRRQQPEIEFLHPEIEYGSRMHSLWAFYWGALNRAYMPSRKTMRDAAEIFMANPGLIDPLKPWAGVDFAALNPVFPWRAYTQSKRDRIAEWVHNRKMLKDDYEGDPRNIFLTSEPTEKAIIKRLVKFKGVREKIASLILIWHQDILWHDNLEKWQEIREVVVSLADIWVMRLIYMMGILEWWDTESHYSASIDIRRFIMYICEKYGLPYSDLSQALWHLGADICGGTRSQPCTGELDSYCRNNCPAFDFCSCVVKSPDLKEKGLIGWSKAIPHGKNLYYPRPSHDRRDFDSSNQY